MPSWSASKPCGSGGRTVKRLRAICGQSRSGGGGGMQKSGYAALQGPLALAVVGVAAVGRCLLLFLGQVAAARLGCALQAGVALLAGAAVSLALLIGVVGDGFAGLRIDSGHTPFVPDPSRRETDGLERG